MEFCILRNENTALRKVADRRQNVVDKKQQHVRQKNRFGASPLAEAVLGLTDFAAETATTLIRVSEEECHHSLTRID